MFLLTHLLRGVTEQQEKINTRQAEFLLTHLLRGVTLKENALIYVAVVSTHTPLARCDSKAVVIVLFGL